MIRDGEWAKLLAVACAAPLSIKELMERADGRFGVLDCEPHSARVAVLRMHRRGFLRVAVRGGRGGYYPKPNLYTLTPEGEAVLDELHRQRGA